MLSRCIFIVAVVGVGVGGLAVVAVVGRVVVAVVTVELV